jgi:hypothetical protein
MRFTIPIAGSNVALRGLFNTFILNAASILIETALLVGIREKRDTYAYVRVFHGASSLTSRDFLRRKHESFAIF